jgi:hypothetical protein
MSDFDDMDDDEQQLAVTVAVSAFSNILDSIVDTHSAVVVIAITTALEVGGLAMLIFARDQIVNVFAAPNSTTYMWAYPVAVINAFLLSLGVARLLVRRPSFMVWLLSMAFGFTNGCVLFVLTT